MQFLESDLDEEFTVVGAVELLQNETLDVLGVTLVEPKVLPRGVGDQIAGPRMSDLVGDRRCQRLVSGLKCTGKKSNLNTHWVQILTADQDRKWATGVNK